MLKQLSIHQLMKPLISIHNCFVKTEQLDDGERIFIQSIETVETTLLNTSFETSNLNQHNVIVKAEQSDDEERIFIQINKVDKTTLLNLSGETSNLNQHNVIVKTE